MPELDHLLSLTFVCFDLSFVLSLMGQLDVLLERAKVEVSFLASNHKALVLYSSFLKEIKLL